MKASVFCVFYTFAPVVTYVLLCYFCSGTAPIINGMAVNELQCGVTYTIIAGRTLYGDLVGPRSSHGNIGLLDSF